MTIKVLLHEENTNYFEEKDILEIPLAMVVYGKEIEIYNELKKLNDGYIILPGYIDNKMKKKNLPMEVQLAVTGKRKKNETIVECFQREIGEEIGLHIHSDLINYKELEDNNLNINFSIINLDNFKSSNFKISKSKDLDNDKIITWLHTNKIDHNLIFNRNRIKSNDIAGSSIIIISVEDLITIFNKWFNKETSFYSKFCFKLN